MPRRNKPPLGNLSPQTIAEHEVAHAVMAHLRGLGPFELRLTKRGGECRRTSGCVKTNGETCVLFNLAGYAWQAMNGLHTIAVQRGDDISVARQALKGRRNEYLRTMIDATGTCDTRIGTVDEAIMCWIARAARYLTPWAGFIERVGGILAKKRYLSARSVCAFMIWENVRQYREKEAHRAPTE